MAYKSVPTGPGCKVYKRRWLILFMFAFYSMSNSLQWIQYSIIGDVVAKFYGVSEMWVEWTSMVFMVSYIILIVPASWALDKFGLRKCVLAGCLGNCLGAWIKVFSTSPTSFATTFIGQCIAAIAQIFVLTLPSRLAAVWFGPDQVSTACGIGVLGYQVGITVGFLMPPLLVQYSEDIDLVASKFGVLYKIVGGLTSIVLVIVIFFFEEQPPLPPSQAALEQKDAPPTNFFVSIRRLVTNIYFDLLLLSYGINCGLLYALSILLNKMILLHFPNAQDDVGLIGFTSCVAGILGCVVSGFVLDKTKRFKETTLFVYVCSLLSMVFCIICLNSGYFITLYFAAVIMGFFLTGYITVGYEFGAELTYPESESTSVGLLNGVSQIFGILFTIGYSTLIDIIGTLKGGLILSCFLILGTILTWLIPKDYKRQERNTDVDRVGGPV